MWNEASHTKFTTNPNQNGVVWILDVVRKYNMINRTLICNICPERHFNFVHRVGRIDIISHLRSNREKHKCISDMQKVTEHFTGTLIISCIFYTKNQAV